MKTQLKGDFLFEGSGWNNLMSNASVHLRKFCKGKEGNKNSHPWIHFLEKLSGGLKEPKVSS